MQFKTEPSRNSDDTEKYNTTWPRYKHLNNEPLSETNMNRTLGLEENNINYSMKSFLDDFHFFISFINKKLDKRARIKTKF